NGVDVAGPQRLPSSRRSLRTCRIPTRIGMPLARGEGDFCNGQVGRNHLRTARAGITDDRAGNGPVDRVLPEQVDENAGSPVNAPSIRHRAPAARSPR
ncbi:MAG: hypothetical protein ACKOWF_02475, partial [Chloroflexota bacterium]